MKKVTMYKASNGKIFENIEKCQAYEKVLKFAKLWEAMKTLKDYCLQKECKMCPFYVEEGTYCKLKTMTPNYWEESDINIEKL